MIKSIVSILLILLGSPAFGQIYGKGVWCAPVSWKISKEEFLSQFGTMSASVEGLKLGIFFGEDESFAYIPIVVNDEASYAIEKSNKASSDEDKIFVGTDSLDRKSLILTTGEVVAQCEVFQSRSYFDREAERLRALIQAAYNSQREGNKI